MVVDHEAQERMSREMEPGEQLLWSGRPRPWHLARAALPIAAFAVPWITFSVFWMSGAAEAGSPAARAGGLTGFPLLGIPFVMLGVVMLMSPLWALSQAKRTVYAVTSRRLLILVSGRSTPLRSFDPMTLAPVQRFDRTDGTGDLLFPDQTLMNAARGYSRLQAMHAGFVGITDAHSVHELIRNTFNR